MKLFLTFVLVTGFIILLFSRKKKLKPLIDPAFHKLHPKFTNEEEILVNRFKKPFYYKEEGLENVEIWINDICDALNGEYAESCEYPEYFIKSKIQHPQELISTIAVNSTKYYYLNNLNLINRGFCPVTGVTLNDENIYQFSMFNRVIYMSRLGAMVCNRIDSEYFSENKLDKETNIYTTRNKSELTD